MPLSIGNEWHYRVNFDKKEIIEKVVSYNVINNKTYSKILRTTSSNGSSFEFMYNLRVSNDTLFHLYFDNAANDYKEKIEAVFSLDINDTIEIVNPNKDETDSENDHIKEIKSRQIIKVVDKNEDKITFVHDMLDVFDEETRTTYQKGVGVVSRIGVMGEGYKLINCNIN